MSWSLQLRNGDLYHHQGQYRTVQGPARVAQDIRIALLTRMGEDVMNPSFGSVIDGGQWTDGTEIPSVIGRIDFDIVAVEVDAELRRIEEMYTAKQLNRIEGDSATYGRTTIRQDEVLTNIATRYSQVQDTLVVEITLSFMSGTPEIIVLPLTTA